MERMVNIETQAFDDLGINPYEVVIAVSKMAREINDKARKYLPPEQEINPTDLALFRLSKDVRFVYDPEKDAPVSTEES